MLPVRRLACAALAAVLALGACSDGDDDEAGDRPEERTTTTVAGGGGDDATIAEPDLDEADPVDGDDEETLDELLAFVEGTRGRDFLARPVVRLADDELYTRLARQLLGIDFQELLDQATLLEALGLIPEGTAMEYAQQLEQQLLDATLGFFDPASEVLLVRGDDLDDAPTRAVVVHELVHAYDDQHLGIGRPAYELDHSSERATTFRMLVEGDASRVEQAYVATLDEAEQEEVFEVNGDPDLDLADLPTILDFQALAPYVAGSAFVTHLAAGGETAVDAAFVDPPATTEQVLHPEAYDRGEGRTPVPPPPADAPIVDQGVHGELFWTGILRYVGDLDAAVATAAATGWGGDAYVAWVGDGGETCLRSDLEGDTEADTAELLDALTVLAEGDEAVTLGPSPEGRVRLEVCFQPQVVPEGNPAR